MLILGLTNTQPSGHAKKHLPFSQPNGTNPVGLKLKISPKTRGVLGAKSVLTIQMTGFNPRDLPQHLND